MSWESWERSAEKGPVGFVARMLVVVVGIVMILAIVSSVFELGMFKFLAPRYEEVKRQVFQESKEYQHGTIQELDKMRLEHAKTNDPEIRRAIEVRATRMVAEFDKNNLPEDLRSWILSIE